MSSMIQFSIDKEREAQWSRFIQKRPDLHGIGMTDAIKKVVFDAMDAVVPLTEKDGGK